MSIQLKTSEILQKFAKHWQLPYGSQRRGVLLGEREEERGPREGAEERERRVGQPVRRRGGPPGASGPRGAALRPAYQISQNN